MQRKTAFCATFAEKNCAELFFFVILQRNLDYCEPNWLKAEINEEYRIHISRRKGQ